MCSGRCGKVIRNLKSVGLVHAVLCLVALTNDSIIACAIMFGLERAVRDMMRLIS
jgi:hypothetical protein